MGRAIFVEPAFPLVWADRETPTMKRLAAREQDIADIEPVANERYAREIAERWNLCEDGVAFVDGPAGDFGEAVAELRHLGRQRLRAPRGRACAADREGAEVP